MAIKNGMKRKLKRQRRTTSTLLTFIALLLLVVTYDLRDGRSGAAVEALDTEAIKECVASDGACASSAATDEETTSIDCIDKHDDCSNWGRDGECDFNPKYMLKDCPRACNACQFDAHNMDKEITRRTRVVNAGGDERCLETPFGISQTINDEGMDAGDVIQLFRKLSTYMEETVLVDHEYETVRDRCKNKSRQCAEWKLNGECETNPLWMNANCSPFCETCLLLDYDHRCPSLDHQEKSPLNAVSQPGDLNKLFERIVHDKGFKKLYQPQVLSRPMLLSSGSSNNDDNSSSSSILPDGPWIVVLDNFLTDEECQSVIQHGTEKGYQVSTSLRNGLEHQKRVSTMRTSTNTWCDTGCLTDEVTQGILQKMEHLTGIPQHNSEHLQLLRYEPGQQCFVHNDYLDYHKDRQMGVRVLTVFLYLSDVDEGGGTYFPDINGTTITVHPKKGRVVLWPSVRDDDPHAEDERTIHGSWAVTQGVKYGANAFIHQRDTREAYARACF